MDKKKIITILGICLACLAIVLLVLAGQGREDPAGPGGHGVSGNQTTAPGFLESNPVQTLPGQTDPAETMPGATDPQQTEPENPEQTIPQQTEPEQSEPLYNTLEFPVELEGGRLTVQSLFQFSGMNPDMDNAEGENIAGLQITNTSDEHLKDAELTAVLADGTNLHFRVQDLPAGMSAMIFTLDNEPVQNVESCEDLYGWAEFESDDALHSDLVEITTVGMEIMVRNISGRSLENLKVYCHSMLDGSCFGGVTYCYTIDSLSAGQSAAVFAWDCILGEAQVVRLELGD